MVILAVVAIPMQPDDDGRQCPVVHAKRAVGLPSAASGATFSA